MPGVISTCSSEPARHEDPGCGGLGPPGLAATCDTTETCAGDRASALRTALGLRPRPTVAQNQACVRRRLDDRPHASRQFQSIGFSQLLDRFDNLCVTPKRPPIDGDVLRQLTSVCSIRQIVIFETGKSCCSCFEVISRTPSSTLLGRECASRSMVISMLTR
jgi:hypothetical protein